MLTDGRTDERTDGNLHAYVFLLKQVRQKPMTKKNVFPSYLVIYSYDELATWLKGFMYLNSYIDFPNSPHLLKVCFQCKLKDFIYFIQGSAPYASCKISAKSVQRFWRRSPLNVFLPYRGMVAILNFGS